MRCLSLAAVTASGTHMSMRGISMSRLAVVLTGTLGRPVIDRTTLEGDFDVDVTYTDETSSAGGDTSRVNAPSLFTAMQEQLGLKLDASRAPVDVIVVDSVGPLAEN